MAFHKGVWFTTGRGSSAQEFSFWFLEISQARCTKVAREDGVCIIMTMVQCNNQTFKQKSSLVSFLSCSRLACVVIIASGRNLLVGVGGLPGFPCGSQAAQPSIGPDSAARHVLSFRLFPRK